MSNEMRKSTTDFKGLGVKDAQAKIAEALDAKREISDSPALSGQEAEERLITITPVLEDERDARARLAEALEEEISEGSQLTEVNANDIFGDTDENPFAAAAAFAEHVRMAEAILFAATEPLDLASFRDRLPEGAKIKEVLETLQMQYENRGVNMRKINNKWQFVTSPDVAHILEKEKIAPRKLSKAALETLSIIAYHQPCSRAEIEEIRGVSISKGSLDILLEIQWITLKGRREDAPGKPVLYGTTQGFLEHFGLEKISHLPGMAELKAAGMLDARLPTDFSIPMPKDDDSVGDGNEYSDPAESEFVEDFAAKNEEQDAEIAAEFDAVMDGEDLAVVSDDIIDDDAF